MRSYSWSWRAASSRKMFSTITTAPSTIMPKSIAPIDSRFAGMCAQSRQMNENSSAKGIVTATMSAVRTLNRNRPRIDEHEQHAAQQVALDRLRRLLDQLGAVVVRDDLHVGRQDVLFSVVGELLDLLQDHLRLLADAHEDDAFDRVVLLHVAELAEPRRVIDRDASPTSLIVTGMPLCAATTMLPMSSSDLHQPEAAHVVELPALRDRSRRPRSRCWRRAAATICGTVTPYDASRFGSSCTWYCIVVAAEARVVGHALDGAVPPVEHPVLDDLQLLRRAIRALQHVAVDQAARAEERRHAGRRRPPASARPRSARTPAARAKYGSVSYWKFIVTDDRP